VDIPEPRKISMLAKRAKQLREKLQIPTFPVMFLSPSSDEIGPTVFQAAKQEDVKVLTRENLEEILRRYARNQETADVIRYIRSVTH